MFQTTNQIHFDLGFSTDFPCSTRGYFPRLPPLLVAGASAPNQGIRTPRREPHRRASPWNMGQKTRDFYTCWPPKYRRFIYIYRFMMFMEVPDFLQVKFIIDFQAIKHNTDFSNKIWDVTGCDQHWPGGICGWKNPTKKAQDIYYLDLQKYQQPCPPFFVDVRNCSDTPIMNVRRYLEINQINQ